MWMHYNGLTFLFHNVLFVLPPLWISEAQMDEGMSIVENALETTNAEAHP